MASRDHVRASATILLGAALLSCSPRDPSSDTDPARASRGATAETAALPACPSGPGPDAQWPRIDVGPFSLQLPPDYVQRDVQGIDSHVGQFTSDGRTLGFDYGAYSNSLSGPDDALRDARACRELIDGRQARVVTARRDSEYFAGAAWRAVGESAVGVLHLTMTVESRDSSGQAEALRIFRGVRFE